MNSKAMNFIAFAAGAAVGVLASRQFFKTKYEQIAQEEINSVKEKYREKNEPYEGYEETDELDEEDIVYTSKPDILEYTAKILENEYTDYAGVDNQTESEAIDEEVAEEEFPEADPGTLPYVIAPEEFGEIDSYETFTLTYFEGDGILADSNNEALDNEDVTDTVGFDSLSHFGEYEQDSVHVRNDRLRADFEILLDPRKYTTVMNKGKKSKKSRKTED